MVISHSKDIPVARDPNHDLRFFGIPPGAPVFPTRCVEYSEPGVSAGAFLADLGDPLPVAALPQQENF